MGRTQARARVDVPGKSRSAMAAMAYRSPLIDPLRYKHPCQALDRVPWQVRLNLVGTRV